jgi:hypothetical protein
MHLSKSTFHIPRSVSSLFVRSAIQTHTKLVLVRGANDKDKDKALRLRLSISLCIISLFYVVFAFIYILLITIFRHHSCNRTASNTTCATGFQTSFINYKLTRTPVRARNLVPRRIRRAPRRSLLPALSLFPPLLPSPVSQPRLPAHINEKLPVFQGAACRDAASMNWLF